MAKLLIINADDFGLSKGQNYGIIEAFNNGVVTSATAMVNAEASEHAAKLKADNPNLAIGLHFVLTLGKPLTPALSLVDDEGNLGKFLWERCEKKEIDLNEVKLELEAQYNHFIELYKQAPTHIDSHHHVHFIDDIYTVVATFAQQKNLPIRKAPVCKDPAMDEKIVSAHNLTVDNVLSSDNFSDEFYGDAISEELLLSILKDDKYQQATSLEIMCHPAFIDKTILKSNYNQQRLDEMAELTNKGLKEKIERCGFVLASFSDLN